MRLLRLLGMLALMHVPLLGGAAEPLLVRLIADDSGFSAQVAARIEAALRRVEPDTVIESDHTGSGRRLMIAVGAKGWRALENAPADSAVLAVLPPRQMFESASWGGGKAISAVYGDMPPGRLFNFVQLLMPKKSGPLALLAGPATQWRLPRLETSANEHGIRLHIEKVERENDVGPAVERLVQKASSLLALPDPVAHTAGTVPPLLLIAYRAGVPVIGYSEAYLRAGAVAALYATPDQIAQQVVEIAAAYRQGRGLPPPQNLKYFSVGVNPSVGRSLGLALPSAEELEARLKAMRE